MSDIWEPSTIGALFEIGAGKSVTPKSRSVEPRFPFLRTANVFWGRIDLTEVDQMHFTAGELEEKSLRLGDLLVCEGGDIGRAAIWSGGLTTCTFQNHLHRLRPRSDEVLPAFYRFYLEAGVTMLGLLDGVGNRTTIPNLSRNRLAALEVPKPPLNEQRKIAAVLGKVQAAVEVEAELIRVTRELKQAALRQLFTRGLPSFAKASAGRRGERETRFGTVPESWGEAPLSSCAFVQTGIAKNAKNYQPDDVEIPYLRVANVQDGHLDLTEMKTIRASAADVEATLLREGDVVLTEGGDFDKLGRGFLWEGQLPQCVHQNHVFAVRTKRDRLDPRFFAYLAQSPYGKAYFLSVAHKTTNLACINTTKLRAFPVLLPDPAEQREIAAHLAVIDAKLTHHEARQKLLRELFRTLLRDLMTARRRVSVALD